MFKSDTTVRLGQLAVRSFKAFAPDAATFAAALDLPENLADTIFARVGEKIAREAVEDFRIDFEDGYGTRPDAEEDGHAASAAERGRKRHGRRHAVAVYRHPHQDFSAKSCTHAASARSTYF